MQRRRFPSHERVSGSLLSSAWTQEVESKSFSPNRACTCAVFTSPLRVRFRFAGAAVVKRQECRGLAPLDALSLPFFALQ